MSILEKLKLFVRIIKNEGKIIDISKSREFSDSFYAAELMRYTHSIEKGLSIPNTKLGFGHQKQKEMMSLLEKLKNSSVPLCIEARKMAVDSLKQYTEYHIKKNYTDSVIEEIKAMLETEYTDDASIGGTSCVDKGLIQFNTEEIEDFFKSRHSVRDFDDTDIDEGLLRKALMLAQTAPSACNRQGYRVHILNRNESNKYAKSLAGIGGFADCVNRFIMITAKLSAYRLDEINQYIVSASMYAAYLTLTLHTYGIGSCVVQRPLIYDDVWDELRTKYKIPRDEQLICLLAAGNLKEKTTVPKSHRLSEDVMFHYVGEDL